MVKTNNIKYDHFKTYYWEDAILVGKYQMPQIEPTQSIPCNVVSFSERNRVIHPEHRWIDHFIDDYRFASVWQYLLRYLPMYSKYAGVIGTDFSMLPELTNAENIWNCTRNRIIDYRLQSLGIDVIPSVGWIDEDSFEWCFDGLPSHGSLAVSNNGCLTEPYSRKLFVKGVTEVIRRLSPSHLIICGSKMSELDGLCNIIYYKSFSARRRGDR